MQTSWSLTQSREHVTKRSEFRVIGGILAAKNCLVNPNLESTLVYAYIRCISGVYQAYKIYSNYLAHLRETQTLLDGS